MKMSPGSRGKRRGAAHGLKKGRQFLHPVRAFNIVYRITQEKLRHREMGGVCPVTPGGGVTAI